MDWKLVEVGDWAGEGSRATVPDFLGFAQRDPTVAGRVRLVEAPLADGTMGGLAVAARIVGVAAREMASLVLVWIHSYTSDVTIDLTSADGRRIQVSGSRVRRMKLDELTTAVARVAVVMDGGAADGLSYVRVTAEGNRGAETAAAPGTGAPQAGSGDAPAVLPPDSSARPATVQ